MIEPSGLLGVPWVWRGRPDWPAPPVEGWDCWGLLRWCVAAHSGVLLASWQAETDGIDPDDRQARWDLQDACLTRGRAGWTRLDRPEPGAGVLLFVGRRPIHCGFCLGDGRFLHVDRTLPTAIDRLDSPRWRDRIEGFYRANAV